jgi:hypothetical protein
VQLRPSNGSRGVLEAAASITKLQLYACEFLDADGSSSLAAALQQLPNLQHLHLMQLFTDDDNQAALTIPSDAFQQLQGLTCLEIEGLELQLPPAAMQDLQPSAAMQMRCRTCSR